jgi:hypothetical protein
MLQNYDELSFMASIFGYSSTRIFWCFYIAHLEFWDTFAPMCKVFAKKESWCSYVRIDRIGL